MKKFILISFFILSAQIISAQIVSTSPIFPKADQPLTITVDVSGTTLDHYAWNNSTSPVWIWAWIEEGCASNCDAPTNVNPATSPAQDGAKVQRISTNPDKYQITFTPTVFFNKPASELKTIGIKLKTKDWNDNKQTDANKYIQFTTSFNITFTSPTQSPVFKNQGDQISITANSSEAADLSLTIAGNEVATASNSTVLNYTYDVTESSGTYEVVFAADNGSEVKDTTFQYVIRTTTVNETRPEGIVDGVNYDAADPTKVTLSLYAPLKTSVYVIGDFSNWSPNSSYQMKEDNDHFWIELSGLTSGQEYAYQYLVDETIKTGDPYAENILDPSNDKYISSSVYPGLKSFPAKAEGIVSVFQTAQTPYNWQSTDFVKPDKSKLTIYELLVRDFSTNRSYQSVIDKLDYLQTLGINAIELMPIMEFTGNDSWGYNPIYYFAVDKAYGPKDKLKELIDKAHERGIAVILDMVLNQADYECPLVKMYWDGSKPAANSPWFNQTATHPFSVFFDFNHESQDTKNFVDRVTEYWVSEYRFDGFRFDLSKGFTQKNSGDNVSLWGNYDASRVAILKRIADKVWEQNPDTYVILEHFADNTEEIELANYGMLLWGNLNYNYSQASMGKTNENDFSWISYKQRGWTNPNVVGYMESHDEERIMYRNITSGNSSGGYNIKNLNVALNRIKATSTFFFTIPGPKMLWQFGELGYDISIDNGGRTGAKPVKWDYYDVANRKALYDHYADLINLRNTYSVFETNDFTLNVSTLQKQIILKNEPYNASPSTSDEMNVLVAGNFDVTTKSNSLAFPHTGTWYDYFTSEALNVTATPFSLSMAAGEYRLYTDVRINDPVTGVEKNSSLAISLFPNPVNTILQITSRQGTIEKLTIRNLQGAAVTPHRINENQWDVKELPAALYIAEIKLRSKTYHIKIIKN
jgi:glycosidase